ncbi:MAG: aminoacyl--tRNA ligase-related protein, partial [Patescibacteria group bacterium]
FAWLPLGLRVLRKVENIVREEMVNLGAQEVLLPALHPKEAWEKTGRWKSFDVLYRLKSQSGKEFALGATHEEVITPVVKAFVQSYRDLPVKLFQIQTKFRDELRPKSGLLRGREFGMKDLYSFHRTSDELQAFLPEVTRAYLEIFERCGVSARVATASGGAFSKDHSFEFQVTTPAGEDRILLCSSCDFAENAEIAVVKLGGKCPRCGKKIREEKGIEVGNTFNLGTTFTDIFDLEYETEEGRREKAVMGCFGLGTTRLVGTIVEANYDERGIMWPKTVAPFDVHLVALVPRGGLAGKGAPRPAAQGTRPVSAQGTAGTTGRGRHEEVHAAADALYGELRRAGADVLWDDRESVSAGEKFADADLLGVPLRLVVSEKTLKADSIEWKERGSAEAKLVSRDEIIKAVEGFLRA